MDYLSTHEWKYNVIKISVWFKIKLYHLKKNSTEKQACPKVKSYICKVPKQINEWVNKWSSPSLKTLSIG